MSKDRATAYHEAGHAVMSHLLRCKVVSVTLGEQDDSLGSVTGHAPGAWFQPDVNGDRRTCSYIENQVLILMSGEAAEFLYTGVHNADGMSSDFSTAVSLAARLMGDNEEIEAYLNWMRIRARNMLRNPRNWRLVEALATALLAEKPANGLRIISGRRALVIIKEARRAMYAEHLERVRTGS